MATNRSSKRILYLDVVKAVAITLVCIGHSTLLVTMDRLGNKFSFIVAFLLSFGSAFIISRCSAKGIDINPVINVVLVYCDLLLDFILGALLYRYAVRKKIQRLRVWQASALLVIIVGLEMLSPTQADDSFYAFFVILLILQFPYQNRLGGYSLPISVVTACRCGCVTPF